MSDDAKSDRELDQRADGYECGKCGYLPTHRELNNGFCPRCPPKKSVAKKEKSQ